MTLYVGNIPYSVKEEELTEVFQEFGTVTSLKIIADKYTGRSKGFGFIEMPSNSEAEQAILALNGNRIDGNNIKVRAADSGGKRSKKKTFRRRNY